MCIDERLFDCALNCEVYNYEVKLRKFEERFNDVFAVRFTFAFAEVRCKHFIGRENISAY